MNVGMSTNALYSPSMSMIKELKETMKEGLTRIEISYYADSKEASDKLLTDEMAT